MEQQYCPFCKAAILSSYNFCPSCGKQIREIELAITTTQQIKTYLLSLILPPLGLFPGIKYLLKGNAHTKHVGLIAIFITLLSTIMSLWAFYGFIQTANKVLNQQINIKQLGY